MTARHAFAVTALAALAACSSSDSDDTTTADNEAIAEEEEEAAAEEEAVAETEAAHENEPQTPTADDLSGIDTDDPETVASAWGCAYWAHPRGETPDELADRLAPLSTPELTDAVTELRISDYGRLIVEVVPGHTEPADQPDTWTVNCHTTTTGTDLQPTGPPTPVTITVQLTDTPNGWAVDQATLPDSGLTIPAP